MRSVYAIVSILSLIGVAIGGFHLHNKSFTLISIGVFLAALILYVGWYVEWYLPQSKCPFCRYYHYEHSISCKDYEEEMG